MRSTDTEIVRNGSFGTAAYRAVMMILMFAFMGMMAWVANTSVETKVAVTRLEIQAQERYLRQEEQITNLQQELKNLRSDLGKLKDNNHRTNP